ncbi:UDP-glycosyltransferase UGT5-like isoform X2 [Anoplolepis gracilipes]|uniref:UDP-glycosyltransferase UGT5-like isoform X2 n=1 Tax=Anoplolepis gracilipes TaxID=354296 RepID=UPI003BA1DFE8
MLNSKCSIIIVSMLWIVADAARILVIVPEPSHSHQVAFRPITMELARRGHEVIIFTPIPINNSTLPNYIEVKLSFSSYKVIPNVDILRLATLGIESLMHDFYQRNEEMTESALSNPVMQQLIAPNSTEKFDLIIMEYLFFDSFLALAYRFNASLIGIASVPPTASHHYLFGNPISWAYLPDLCANLDQDMNLLDRFVNAYYNLYQILWHQYMIVPVQEKMVKKYFGNNVPPLHELISTMDLLLANSHLFLYPHPSIPGIIPIRGSRQINQNDHLPQDLKKILDDAKEGFIYFSLGSNVKGTFLSAERRDMFRKTFEKLPYKVLWKYESELPDKPNNVITRKWLPQHAVLAHPNIRLFIYQGGLQSTEETIENGVPVIGLSVLADQHYNVKQLETYGAGKKLSITNINENELRKTIFEIITNSSYKNNIIRLRDLLKDLPYNPLDNAVWWIEHVIRHKGAKHLWSNTRNMPWYKIQLWDIGLIILVLSVLIVYISVLIIRFIFRIVKRKLIWKRCPEREESREKKQQ